VHPSGAHHARETARARRAGAQTAGLGIHARGKLVSRLLQDQRRYRLDAVFAPQRALRVHPSRPLARSGARARPAVVRHRPPARTRSFAPTLVHDAFAGPARPRMGQARQLHDAEPAQVFPGERNPVALDPMARCRPPFAQEGPYRRRPARGVSRSERGLATRGGGDRGQPQRLAARTAALLRAQLHAHGLFAPPVRPGGQHEPEDENRITPARRPG